VVGAIKPGKNVTAEIFRKGATRNIALNVGSMPDDQDEAKPSKPSGKAAEANRLGLMLRDLSAQEKKKANLKSGLLIVGVQGAAAQVGIRQGDVLLTVGDYEAKSVDQINRLLEPVAAGKVVALRVMRGNNLFYVTVKVAAK
jgi:serine protease Do